MIALSALALILVFVAQHFDEYLRRTLETKINQRLQGYSVSLGDAHLNPFGLALTLEQAIIRQQANPQPPVADIPRLTASVQWGEILHGHLVANGSASFRDDSKGPDFNIKVAVEKASLPSINELLRAYGKLDVATPGHQGHQRHQGRGMPPSPGRPRP